MKNSKNSGHREIFFFCVQCMAAVSYTDINNNTQYFYCCWCWCWCCRCILLFCTCMPLYCVCLLKWYEIWSCCFNKRNQFPTLLFFLHIHVKQCVYVYVCMWWGRWYLSLVLFCCIVVLVIMYCCNGWIVHGFIVYYFVLLLLFLFLNHLFCYVLLSL